MKISLGSKSINKKNILLKEIKYNDIVDIICNDVNSGISEQPLTEEETIQGARNRAKNSFFVEQNVDLSFGMEGGLSKINGIYNLVCVTAIYTKDGNYYLGISSKLPLPLKVSNEIEKFKEFGVVIRQYQNNLSKDDAEYHLVKKLIDREDLFKESIQKSFLLYSKSKLNRIAIIGISGSGKSTFANKLGKKLNRPIIHLDKEYWTSDWKAKYPVKEDWNNFIKELVKQDQWIIDGNYRSTVEIRLERADTIIYFDIPKWRAVWRAFIRVFNRKQPFDKTEGIKEKFDLELVRYIINYPKNKILSMVESYRNKSQVFIVRNNKDCMGLLSKLN